MSTPRFRPFLRQVVLPAAVAMLLAVLTLPALNIIRVDARGMGHEHGQPWRSRASVVAAAALLSANTFVRRLRRSLERLIGHPAFAPTAIVAVAVLALFLNQKAILAAPFILGTTSLTEGTHAGMFLLEERMEAGRPSRETITVLSGQNLAAGAVVGRVTKGIGRVSIPTVVTTQSSNGTVSKVFAGPEVQLGSYVLTCTAEVANGGVWSLVCPDGKALPALTMTPGGGGATNYRSRHINFTITDGSTDFHAGDTFTFVVNTTAPGIIGGTGTGTISALALGPDAVPGNYRVICIEAITNGGRFQVYRGGPDGGVAIGEFLMAAGSGAATAFETREISFTLTDAADVIVGNYFDVCVFNTLSGGKVVAYDPTTYDGRNLAVAALYDAVDATSADATGVIVTRDATFRLADLAWATAISESEKVSGQNDLLKRGIVCR